jgi:V-type H+-transporting ATPase subunit d
MIDNIVLLITGTLNQRSTGDLLPRCHPLGSFEQLGAITVADTPAQLYTAVLVDTPLGKIIQYFYLIKLFFLISSIFY